MFNRHKYRGAIAYAAVAVLGGSGCATAPYWTTTAYGTMRYSRSEVETLPIVSIGKILASGSATETERTQLCVRSQNLDEPAEVTRLAGAEEVVVVDTRGQEVRLKLAQITAIDRIRRVKVAPRPKPVRDKTEEVAESFMWAPTIPVGMALWPVLRLLGLDAGKNADDNEKAQLAYAGMSRDDLVAYIGEPRERYACDAVAGQRAEEVWVYDTNKVLRGGRAMFIRLDRDRVYHASYDTSFFKNSGSYRCTPMVH